MLQDKYRPQSLEAMQRVSAANILKGLPLSSVSNLILTGPEGAGKRTLFSAFIKHTLQSTPVFHAYTSTYEVSPSKSVEVEFLESKEVLEVKIEGLGGYDKKVLQKVASDISATKSIKTIISMSSSGAQAGTPKEAGASARANMPKILLIPDGHLLSTGAQMALRRVLEKGASNFRLVILTTSVSHLIPAFRSRFLVCRVPSPTDQELAEMVREIAVAEGMPVPCEAVNKIVSLSNGNIRVALSLLELAIHREPVSEAPWDATISSLVKGIQTSPSIKFLIETRGVVYSLLTQHLPANHIMLSIMQGLLKKEKAVDRAKTITELAAKYTGRLCAGTKDMFHIEAFIANAMVLYTE
ncbi:replication factor C subunit 3/5 [Nematocida major]|uniref:replication factor C subunit 3/5 n=1 Tax=Nematocida major TaxID=1912982 RepID=UPI002007DC7D|nr:replication factor C subunit 3/5 [Nematocida major]KAH9385521.1 replication factor C subunit 3/5 [Nematocida major]